MRSSARVPSWRNSYLSPGCSRVSPLRHSRCAWGRVSSQRSTAVRPSSTSSFFSHCLNSTGRSGQWVEEKRGEKIAGEAKIEECFIVKGVHRAIHGQFWLGLLKESLQGCQSQTYTEEEEGELISKKKLIPMSVTFLSPYPNNNWDRAIIIIILFTKNSQLSSAIITEGHPWNKIMEWDKITQRTCNYISKYKIYIHVCISRYMYIRIYRPYQKIRIYSIY